MTAPVFDPSLTAHLARLARRGAVLALAAFLSFAGLGFGACAPAEVEAPEATAEDAATEEEAPKDTGPTVTREGFESGDTGSLEAHGVAEDATEGGGGG